MDWILLFPQKSHVEALTGYKGEAWTDRISVLIRKDTRELMHLPLPPQTHK